MTRILLTALTLLTFPVIGEAPAAAQSVAGCGAATIAKADQSNAGRLTSQADCFGKVKTIATTAEAARRARVAAITPAPIPSPVPAPPPSPSPTPTPAPAASTNISWIDCAGQGERCVFTGEARVRFGVGGRYAVSLQKDGVLCSFAVLGDPAPGEQGKRCGYQPAADLVTIPPAKAQGMRIGINLAAAQYYSGEQVFANLATGDNWRDTGTRWSSQGVTPDALGGLSLPAGKRAWRVLSPPASVLSNAGATVVCTWQGNGTVAVNGERGAVTNGDHRIEFFWPGRVGVTDKLVWIDLSSTGPGVTISDLDCREKGVDRSEVFGAEFVASLKPFGVLRFMDWSAVNANPAVVTWATRTPAASIDQAMTPMGVALEHQIAIANRVGADPWFNVAWNADENYQRRMARMVHDGIPADRHVYVELSNELWNYSFGQTRQAESEGVAAGLSTDPFRAMLLRHAQKTQWMMRIWAEVFADRPGQLVRVLATQGGNPWAVEVPMAAAAADVDALSIAPYFGNSLLPDHPGVTDLGVLLPAVRADMDRVMTGWAQSGADIAKKYGKRLIAYEAGQHVIDGPVETLISVNRSDAMGPIYRDYLLRWKAQFDDTIMLYNSTGPISVYGAWGLREYAGQPLSETPKRRAVLDYVAGR